MSIRAAAPLLAALSLLGCAGNPGYGRDLAAANAGELDVVATALVVGHCGRFAAAVERAGLDELLDGPGPFTVFVPLDQAFLTLQTGEHRAWRDDPERLRHLLLHHVVDGDVRAPRLVHARELVPREGSPLPVAIVDSQAMVGPARIVRGDVVARNGVLHFVDRLLLPETAATPDGR